MGFPGDASGKESACRCSRCKRPWFNPWVGKMLGKGNDNPLLEKIPLTDYSPWGCKELDMTEHLSVAAGYNITKQIYSLFRNFRH